MAAPVSTSPSAPRSATELTAPSGSAVSEQVDSIPSVVDATDVVIVGDLDGEQVAMIEWALDRFAQTDLTLPVVIRVTFDPSRAQCRSELGVCHPRQDPPEVVVCEPDGQYAMQQMNQRITLLHELAHLWYRAALDGPDAPDFPTIVGGRASSPEVPWEERTEERVAVVISWGLMDQYRRPVLSELTCAELSRQFLDLSGHLPLGPLEPVCLPDESLR
jgi:hypothetical protein